MSGYYEDVVNRVDAVVSSGKDGLQLLGSVLATLRVNVDRGDKSIVQDPKTRAELLTLLSKWEVQCAALELKMKNALQGKQ